MAAEADQGLAAKQAHLGQPEPPTPPPDHAVPRPEVRSVQVTVTDPHGLHARPAAALVALAARFDAVIGIEDLDAGTGPADARSLSAVATLDARSGHRLRVTATGPQAEHALTAIGQLVRSDFGDPASPDSASSDPASPDPAPAGAVAGGGLDLALGPALVRRIPDLAAYAPGDVGEERRRSAGAVAAVDAQLAGLEQRRPGPAAAILAAQRTLLSDPEITAAVAADLAAGISAVDAWRRRLDAVAERFAALADPYQRERATDVRSVQTAVLRALTGATEDQAPMRPEHVEGPSPGSGRTTPVILVVDELDLTTAAAVDAEQVAGIVVTARGRTGHGAIVAGSRGIPLFTGAGAAAADITNGQLVAFDARRGRLWTAVSDERVRRWPEYVAERQAEHALTVVAAGAPALTRDGVAVPVLANIGSIADAERSAAYGA
ncbi:MAG TPA: HPr family phosphocarrier protein, partial [Propionibacteriaceae bacterium]|nr:HPr family phosphocarrier protein [Propionibacteriaceae bacterium]